MKALLFVILAHFVLSDYMETEMEGDLASQNEHLREVNSALREALYAMTEDESALASSDWCSEGVRNGQTCCEKSCGKCGGKNCSKRQGGAKGCCMKKIRKSERVCDNKSSTSCLIPKEPEKYWVNDGCTSDTQNSQSNLQGDFRAPDELHGVRCCNDAGTDCTTSWQCNSRTQLTYEQATQYCARESRRLCTKDEINKQICCGTGGMCDLASVWTKTSNQNAEFALEEEYEVGRRPGHRHGRLL